MTRKSTVTTSLPKKRPAAQQKHNISTTRGRHGGCYRPGPSGTDIHQGGAIMAKKYRLELDHVHCDKLQDPVGPDELQSHRRRERAIRRQRRGQDRKGTASRPTDRIFAAVHRRRQCPAGRGRFRVQPRRSEHLSGSMARPTSTRVSSTACTPATTRSTAWATGSSLRGPRSGPLACTRLDARARRRSGPIPAMGTSSPLPPLPKRSRRGRGRHI